MVTPTSPVTRTPTPSSKASTSPLPKIEASAFAGASIPVNVRFDGGAASRPDVLVDYQSPKHHAEVCEQARTWRETPYVVDGLYVSVDDVDAHYAQARAADATILSELEDNTGIGQRQYRAEDLEGHRWMFAMRL